MSASFHSKKLLVILSKDMGDSSIDDATDNDLVMKATVTTAYNNIY